MARGYDVIRGKEAGKGREGGEGRKGEGQERVGEANGRKWEVGKKGWVEIMVARKERE